MLAKAISLEQLAPLDRTRAASNSPTVQLESPGGVRGWMGSEPAGD